MFCCKCFDVAFVRLRALLVRELRNTSCVFKPFCAWRLMKSQQNKLCPQPADVLPGNGREKHLTLRQAPSLHGPSDHYWSNLEPSLTWSRGNVLSETGSVRILEPFSLSFVKETSLEGVHVGACLHLTEGGSQTLP